VRVMVGVSDLGDQDHVIPTVDELPQRASKPRADPREPREAVVQAPVGFGERVGTLASERRGKSLLVVLEDVDPVGSGDADHVQQS
jgi:hypothetical protein